ncbi:cupin domain-containing protein [Methanococcus sp. CF]
MIEEIHNFNKSDKKLVEMLVNTEDIQIRHVVLPKGDFMPKHISNSNVNLVIIDGEMEITLEAQNPVIYEKGTILSIPFNTKMLIKNENSKVLEFFVLKAPHPKKLGGPDEAIKC